MHSPQKIRDIYLHLYKTSFNRLACTLCIRRAHPDPHLPVYSEDADGFRLEVGAAANIAERVKVRAVFHDGDS